jgi:sec-independent protein translocase protein TatB
MLDLGWSELLIIGVAALIVVGPKDLPRMLRTLGQYAAKARGIAREFQRSMDEAARQADIEELKEVKKDLDNMRDAQYQMQRDMTVSLSGNSKKPEPKTPKEKSKPEAPAAATSAPESEAPSAAPTEAAAKPGTDSGGTGGA